MKNKCSKFKIKHDHIVVESNNKNYDIDGGVVDLPKIKVCDRMERIVLYQAQQDRMMIERKLVEENEEAIYNFVYELFYRSLFSNGGFLTPCNETQLVDLTYEFLRDTSIHLDLQPLNRTILTQFLNEVSIYIDNIDISSEYEEETEKISDWTDYITTLKYF